MTTPRLDLEDWTALPHGLLAHAHERIADLEAENARLREALSLAVEEIDDPGRRQPWFSHDPFSHRWEPSGAACAVWLSPPCLEALRAAAAALTQTQET